MTIRRRLAAWGRVPAMTLRRRLMIAFISLMTVAIALVGAISYSATVAAIRAETDSSLTSAAAELAAEGNLPPPDSRSPGRQPSSRPRDGDDTQVSLAQRIAPDGSVTTIRGPESFSQPNPIDLQLAASGTAGSGHFDERHAGESKYPLGKMIRFALDAITGFSTAPLRFASHVGLVLTGLSALLVLYIFAGFLMGAAIPGWTSLMLVVVVLGAVQMFVLGMIGEYLGRLYVESKRRPLYIVADVAGPVMGHASLGYRYADSGEVSVSPVTPREV